MARVSGRSSIEGTLVDWVVDRPYAMVPLPVELLDRDQTATELQRLQAERARLAAYEAALVLRLAEESPDSFDPPPDSPGASKPGWDAGNRLPGVSEFFTAELAMILNSGRGTAAHLAARSWTYRENLPSTWAAMRAGELDEQRAKALAEVLELAAPDVARWVEAQLLPEAADLSIPKLRKRALALLLERDAEAADRRRKRAQRDADVHLYPSPLDGMSTLAADLPSPDAAACFDLIDQLAKMLKADGDPRPIGQLRAEVFADLVRRPWDTTRPTVTGRLELIASLDSLAGRTEQPGEVNGLPITIAHLRELLARLHALRTDHRLHLPTPTTVALTDLDGTLRATVSAEQLARIAKRGCPEHPAGDCRCPLLDRPPKTDAYEPTAAQRTWVKTRDRTCRFPNCGQRVGWADLDHVIAHACGGETDCTNLCCLCRSHHRLKTFARGWRFTMSPDGVLSVTTPSGITRTTRPPGLRPPPPASEPAADVGRGGPHQPVDDPPPF